MAGKNGETECRLKHSILIRSDRKCFEAFRILH